MSLCYFESVKIIIKQKVVYGETIFSRTCVNVVAVVENDVVLFNDV